MQCHSYPLHAHADRVIATKMLRSVSREGPREPTNNPPLSKKRSSGRVQSARLSEDKLVKGMYRDISKFVIHHIKYNFLTT